MLSHNTIKYFRNLFVFLFLMIIISIILISVYQTSDEEKNIEKISDYSTYTNIGWSILILSLIVGWFSIVYITINNYTDVTTHTIQVSQDGCVPGKYIGYYWYSIQSKDAMIALSGHLSTCTVCRVPTSIYVAEVR